MSNSWKYDTVKNRRIFYIYKAISPSGKSYIGYTSRKLKYRIKEHLKSANNGSNSPFHNAIRKYGNNIKFEIINIYFNKKLAVKMEQIYIKKYKSLIVDNGYNIKNEEFDLTSKIFSKKSRKKISESNKKRWKKDKEKLLKIFKEKNKNNTISKKALESSILTNSKSIIDSKGCIYMSLAEAAKFSGVTESAIRIAINNGYTPNGIKFSYYNNGNFFFKIRYNNFVKCNNNGKIYKNSKEAAQDLDLKNAISINRVCRNERNSYLGYSFDYVIGVI